MIVTHFRKVDVKVRYREPEGTELSRLTKKSATAYVYIGTPVDGGDEMVIQLNDKFASPADISDFVRYERGNMSSEDRQNMTVSINADRKTPMRTITAVKQALRTSGVFNINYAAGEKPKNAVR